MRRRYFIAAIGSTSTLAVAGCGSQESDRQEGSADDGGGSESESGSADDSSSETESSSADDGSEQEQLVELLDHSFYNEGQFDIGVSGTLENVSGEELSYVEVDVFFLDSEGTQIGEGLDNTSDLAAGRAWEFDATYLGEEGDRIETYEIETEVTNF